jgi:hypothetical protein
VWLRQRKRGTVLILLDNKVPDSGRRVNNLEYWAVAPYPVLLCFPILFYFSIFLFSAPLVVFVQREWEDRHDPSAHKSR